MYPRKPPFAHGKKGISSFSGTQFLVSCCHRDLVAKTRSWRLPRFSRQNGAGLCVSALFVLLNLAVFIGILRRSQSHVSSECLLAWTNVRVRNEN